MPVWWQEAVVALIVGGCAVALAWRLFGLFGPRGAKAPGCDHCPAKRD